MPGRLDRRDRQLLAGAGALLVLLVVLAALVGPAQVAGTTTVPSSYSPSWNGAKGAYLLLGQLGYRVERWVKPAAEIAGPARGAVLILANPSTGPTAEDRSAIRRFVAEGGRVLATGSSAGGYLPDALALPPTPAWQEMRMYPPLEPTALAHGVRAIALPTPGAWRPTGIRQVAAFGDRDTAAVVVWPFGQGEVIWWASAAPLTNGGILQADNVALLLNSLGGAGTRVIWDEYVHGVKESLWGFFEPTPLPWILAQIGLAFLALLFTYSRRQGLARTPAVPSRLSPLEFVETLGDLYYTAHAGAAAVGIAYGRLRSLLTRQLGLPAGAPTPEISRRASERLGWEEAALAETLGRAERFGGGAETGDEAALGLVREIHEGIARLEIRRGGGGKGARR